MMLKDWMKSHRGQQGAMADEIGMDESTLSRKVSGEYKIWPEEAEMISAYTRGEVSIEEMLYPDGLRPGARLAKPRKRKA